MANTMANVALGAVTGSSPDLNVGDAERWASLAGGGLLIACGLSARDRLCQVAMPLLGGMLAYRGLTGHCSVYGALGVNTARKDGHASLDSGEGVKVERSVTVNMMPWEVYRRWRDFEQLPRFMSHLEEVKSLGGRRSHWVAKAPLGMRVEWDAEVIRERPGEMIAWRSLLGADVDTAGSVHFKPAAGGTEVRVSLRYDPPGGKLGATMARWLGESPEIQLDEDLQRFKRTVETDKVAHAV